MLHADWGAQALQACAQVQDSVLFGHKVAQLVGSAAKAKVPVLHVQEAQAVVQQVNGFKLDKSHTFAVNLFDDVSRYMQVPDEYEAPEDKEFSAPVSLSASTMCQIFPASLCQWLSSTRE